MEKVPVLDLVEMDRQEQVETLDLALQTFGFFYLKNHNLKDLVKPQFEMAEQLFDLPPKEKQAMPFDAKLDIGYVGQEGQNLDPNDHNAMILQDTKEQFMQTNNVLITTCAGSADLDPPSMIDPNHVFNGSQNYQPNNLDDDYTGITGQYASLAYQLNHTLNDLLFEALGLDPQTTRNKLARQPFVVLKQMKYHHHHHHANPEQSNSSNNNNNKLLFGAGAHTDWGAFTILATDETPGLQIYHNDKWLPVPPKPNCLIINSGDQISFWTRNHYKSALHRVVVDPVKNKKPRYSTAFFTYFDLHVRVQPLEQFATPTQPIDDNVEINNTNKHPHASRTTLEYFHYKLHESFGV